MEADLEYDVLGNSPVVPCVLMDRPKHAPRRARRRAVLADSQLPDPNVGHKLLTALQCARASTKAEKFFLVMVTEKDDVVTVDVPVKPVLSPAIQQVMDEYKSVFEEIPYGLPPDRGEGHTIPLEPGAVPPFKRMYRMSPKEKLEVDKQVKSLMAKGWVEPSTSPYGAPVLFVVKKGGELRMCIDFRALNKLTIKNRYPLPRIDDLMDKLHGATVFSSLDLQQGYHQLLISKEDVPKTAFLTHMGLYQYKVLCFGLCNAPSTFQTVMNRVFSHCMSYTVVYMDDILVFSKNEEEHVEHLREVMATLQRARMFAKASKCQFARSSMSFLGHIISAEGISVDPKKTDKVKDWPTPENIDDVRSFLGLATYFRKFVPNFANLAAPMYLMMRKGAEWSWSKAADDGFHAIKLALISPPCLAIPNLRDDAPPFYVHTDASITGLGAILMQEERPCAYESRKLIPAEVNYATGEQELLAVVHALRVWRCYLEGRQFTVVTDHKPITFLQTQQTLSRRQTRWSEFLQSFTFEWLYKPGKSNPADPLSRLKVAEKVLGRIVS